ncbi:MAG TPA: polysaccharide export protein [Candidatus Bariatricus faecipullorum]|nr:polysaccharide export protein [Candidatus Bariatricus faecipullorum]
MEEQKTAVVPADDEIEIDLTELFQLLLQKIWVILLCMILAGGIVLGGTLLLITPKYEASSMIYILTKTTSVTSLADIQMGEQLTVDFETLAESRPVIEAVIDDLNLDYTYEEMTDMISTENPTDTRILRLIVENEDAELAKDISNSLAEATAERVAYVMKSDEPTIVENAVTADSPSSPNVLKNTAMGALAGAVLAMAVIVIRYLMNDTIQTEDDIRKYLNLHTLAAIPMEKRR